MVNERMYFGTLGRHCGVIDFFNSDNGKKTDPKESPVFKKLAEKYKTGRLKAFIKEYQKVQKNIENAIHRSNSVIAVLQARNNNLVDKRQFQADDFDIVYAEHLHPGAAMPNKEELVQRFRSSYSLDNYYGSDLRDEFVVVTYDKNSNTTRAYSFEKEVFKELDGFVNDKVINRVRGNFDVRVEEFYYRMLIRIDGPYDCEVLPKAYLNRANELVEKYFDKFVEIDLNTPDSLGSVYESKYYSLYYSKVYTAYIYGNDLIFKNSDLNHEEPTRYFSLFASLDEEYGLSNKELRRMYERIPEPVEKSHKMSQWHNKIKLLRLEKDNKINHLSHNREHHQKTDKENR